ncbi:MAG: hypothetical protein K2Y13_06115 [Burkholderiaceae bacterium]|uniref:PIN domain-containing protein n=2 Tax=Herminiimonas contaminans TaxID=1111140 RepID=A0ABS0EV21_9BURK|nr:hypothetical protein [Herminiimonas contaminans]MBX9799018.1 hypothetical protein [Burkholderiaceae bacterium]
MLEYVLEKLINLLGPIATLSKDKRELKDNALSAISIALTETKLYYRDRERGKPRNPKTEAKLAKVWAAAAIPLRHIDEELAMACQHKAEFWIAPENWNAEELSRLGIRLSDVSSAYHRLAMPRYANLASHQKPFSKPSL